MTITVHAELKISSVREFKRYTTVLQTMGVNFTSKRHNGTGEADATAENSGQLEQILAAMARMGQGTVTVEGNAPLQLAQVRKTASSLLLSTDPRFRRHVSTLAIPPALAEFLVRAGMPYIGDVVTHKASVIAKLPGLGGKKFESLEKALAEEGLSFGLQVRNWPPADLER